MHLTETLIQVEGLPRTPFHPQVQKSLLRLMLLRDGISVRDIACAIAEWTPIEQLWHLEFLFLKISRRIDPAIKSEPQYSIRASGKLYRVDFKLSLRDDVLPSLPSVIYFVELDGRGFYDRTKEDFLKERQRLRDLQRQGARVYTFAGEEVFKNPTRCVLEAVRDLERDLMQRRHVITLASVCPLRPEDLRD
jgi:hypothetical protein